MALGRSFGGSATAARISAAMCACTSVLLVLGSLRKKSSGTFASDEACCMAARQVWKNIDPVLPWVTTLMVPADRRERSTQCSWACRWHSEEVAALPAHARHARRRRWTPGADDMNEPRAHVGSTCRFDEKQLTRSGSHNQVARMSKVRYGYPHSEHGAQGEHPIESKRELGASARALRSPLPASDEHEGAHTRQTGRAGTVATDRSTLKPWARILVIAKVLKGEYW
eukprot:1766268-Prymnesium_polylepis.1